MPPRPIHRDGLRIALVALIEDELRRQRPHLPATIPPHAWNDHTPLARGGLECDSLETLALAARVNQMFHLHEVGDEQTLLTSPTLGDWLDIIERTRRARAHRLTFLTSGSTGHPKPCEHQERDLWQEADLLRRHHHDRARIVLCVPSHHIYGFIFGVLLPHALGVPVLNARDMSPGVLAAALQPSDLIVNIPIGWAYIARSLRALPRGIQGVVSTGPCAPEITAELQSAGLERLTEYYGSSETGGIARRVTPADPFELHEFWRRRGETLVRIPEDRPPTDPIAPMDHLHWVDDRRFHLRGRVDHAVKIGGRNAFPGRVTQILRSAPGVRDATVRAAQGVDGPRLKAFIVPISPQEPLDHLRAELDDLIDRLLEPHERPRSLTFGAALPMNVAGKPSDW